MLGPFPVETHFMRHSGRATRGLAKASAQYVDGKTLLHVASRNGDLKVAQQSAKKDVVPD